MKTAIRDQVNPTYAKFTKFVAEEYAPKGRTEPGAWSLPDGEAYYACALNALNGTCMTPCMGTTMQCQMCIYGTCTGNTCQGGACSAQASACFSDT